MKPTHWLSWSSRAPLIGAASAGLLFFASIVSIAQDLGGGLDPKAQLEIEYFHGLMRLGMADYANMVLEQVKKKFPDAESWIVVTEIQGKLAVGQFKEVEDLIKKQADQDSQNTWAMRLALADGYFAWGRYPEAQGIYESLFKKFPDAPPEALNEFYMNSAYKYAQMLVLMGNERRAVDAYRNVLKAKVPKHVERQVMGEMAELLVKMAGTASDKPGDPVEVDVKDPKTGKMTKVKKPVLSDRAQFIKEAEEICGKILWVQDLWFGKAIVNLAYIKKLKGDVDGAMKLMDDYREQLRGIDENLAKEEEETGQPLTKLSPMAQCRYLVGVIMQEEADKIMAQEGGDRQRAMELLAGKELKEGKRSLGAYQHLLNVFIRYPSTAWAPDAGDRVRRIEDVLKKDFGAEIKTKISPEQMEEVKKQQFKEARTLFSQQQFKNAIDSYITVLNLFPEGATAVDSLSELARCYIEENDEIHADMVIAYLAERFSPSEELSSKAGDELLRIAEVYGERQMPDRKDAVYARFFLHFRKHPRAAPMVFLFGERKFREDDMPAALTYYQDIVDNYSSSPLYVDALNKMAYAYAKTENLVGEINALTKFIEAYEKRPNPGQILINAMYRQAVAYKKLASDYLKRDDPKQKELGNKYVGTAVVKFSKLAELLADPKNPYQSTDDEKEQNRKIREGAIFNKAHGYALLTQPEDKVKGYKMMAIKTYKELVEQFPKSEWAPISLSQAGTLWTILENPEEAQLTLKQLQKDYPESPEAKNAQFMLGKSLLELNRRQNAVRVFADMFQGEGQYTDAQFLTVGRELLKINEYDVALEAFEIVVKRAKERGFLEPALVGKGQILVEKKRFAEGAEILEKVLKDYENTGYTVEVCLYLTRAYSELGMQEPDAKKRFDIFNSAVNAIKRARKYNQDKPAERTRSDIEVARIGVLKAQAEEKFGTKPKAVEYRQDAIATYQTIILLANASDEAVRPHIEDAYHECTPLLLEAGNLENVLEDCERYLSLFPRGKYVLDMTKWQGEARRRAVMAGKSPTVAPAAGELKAE